MIRQIAIAAAILFGAAGARADGVNSNAGQANPIPGANAPKNHQASPNPAQPTADKDSQVNQAGHEAKADQSPATSTQSKPKMTRKGPRKPGLGYSKTKPTPTSKKHVQHKPRPTKKKPQQTVMNKGGGV